MRGKRRKEGSPFPFENAPAYPSSRRSWMTIPDDLSDCDANDEAAIELIDSNGDGPIRAEARENEGGERVRAATFLHAIYVCTCVYREPFAPTTTTTTTPRVIALSSLV